LAILCYKTEADGIGARLDDIRRRWSWQTEQSRLRRRNSALDLTEWPTSIRCVPMPWTRSVMTHLYWTKSIDITDVLHVRWLAGQMLNGGGYHNWIFYLLTW